VTSARIPSFWRSQKTYRKDPGRAREEALARGARLIESTARVWYLEAVNVWSEDRSDENLRRLHESWKLWRHK
jgi:hypothetical protein